VTHRAAWSDALACSRGRGQRARVGFRHVPVARPRRQPGRWMLQDCPRPPGRLPPGDLDSVSGWARLYYRRAAELFETATRGMRRPADCAPLRHSSVTHAAEDGTCTSLLAHSGHASCPASPGMRGSVPSPRPLAGTARPGTAQVFRFAAGLAWRRQGAGVQVLEGNMRSYARYWLEAFRLPVVPVDRLVGVPVDQRGTRHRPVSRSRRPRRGPSIREAALMPGIIRCPESTAIRPVIPITGAEARNPAFLPAAGPGVRIPGRRGQRSHHVVAVVPLSVPSARLEPRPWWLRTDACRRVGIAAPAGDLR
jgi:hypothetical protein